MWHVAPGSLDFLPLLIIIEDLYFYDSEYLFHFKTKVQLIYLAPKNTCLPEKKRSF